LFEIIANYQKETGYFGEETGFFYSVYTYTYQYFRKQQQNINVQGINTEGFNPHFYYNEEDNKILDEIHKVNSDAILEILSINIPKDSNLYTKIANLIWMIFIGPFYRNDVKNMDFENYINVMDVKDITFDKVITMFEDIIALL
jgi:hypothetical protein